MTQVEFENEVFRLLVEKEEGKDLLTMQYESSTISREYTGFGFFTNFEFNEPINKLKIKDKVIRSVHIMDNKDNCIGEVILFIKSGFIVMLEGYSFDSPWPTNYDNLYFKTIL